MHACIVVFTILCVTSDIFCSDSRDGLTRRWEEAEKIRTAAQSVVCRYPECEKHHDLETARKAGRPNLQFNEVGNLHIPCLCQIACAAACVYACCPSAYKPLTFIMEDL